MSKGREELERVDFPRESDEGCPVEVEEAAAMNANRLLAGMSDCSGQIWNLHDLLVKTVQENAGLVCERLREEHKKIVNEYLNRFVLLNRLTDLDLSGEVQMEEATQVQTANVLQDHELIFQTVHESGYYK